MPIVLFDDAVGRVHTGTIQIRPKRFGDGVYVWFKPDDDIWWQDPKWGGKNNCLLVVKDTKKPVTDGQRVMVRVERSDRIVVARVVDSSAR